MAIKQVECFGQPNDYMLGQLGKKESVVWNGEVLVKRYRITVEEIEEPMSVLKERLEALLHKRGHVSDYASILAEAKRLGIELNLK